MPFAPALLERKLEKVESTARHEIDNSLDGLRAYLSALNIRNKCKHPLFLVLRFNACVGLWYDTTTGADPLADDDAFCSMMLALGALDGKTCELATGELARLPPFVIAIKALHEAHACHHLGCPVRLPSSLSLPHAATLPSTYRELCDHQLATLRRTYCRIYCAACSGIVPHAPRLAPAPPTACSPAGRPAPPGAPGGVTHLTLAAGCPADKRAGGQLVFHSADQQKTQQHAAALLASARQMVVSGGGGGGAGGGGEEHDEDDCPNREWEAGLLVLAEALALQ